MEFLREHLLYLMVNGQSRSAMQEENTDASRYELCPGLFAVWYCWSVPTTILNR